MEDGRGFEISYGHLPGGLRIAGLRTHIFESGDLPNTKKRCHPLGEQISI
jgi:hypothetical protein